MINDGSSRTTGAQEIDVSAGSEGPGQGDAPFPAIFASSAVANSPPTALGGTASFNEDTSPVFSVASLTDDPDGDPLSIDDISISAGATVTLLGGLGFEVTPDPDYNGPLTLTYSVTDGTDVSNTAQLEFTVVPVNDDPVAANDLYSVYEDVRGSASTALGVLRNDSDVDGDPLTVSLVTDVAHGTLVLQSDGAFTYAADADWTGTDSFTYLVDDGNGGTDEATVRINVLAVNDAPTASGSSATLSEDIPQVFSLSGLVEDVDGDPLSIEDISISAGATVTPLGGLGFEVTPDPDYNGPLTLTYSVTDGTEVSNTAQIEFTVTPVNDDPVAANDLYGVYEDVRGSASTALGVLRNDSDVDGDPLTVSLVTDVAHGTLVLRSDGAFTYAADADWTGTDSFTYLVDDGNGGSDEATVRIKVLAVNDAPVIAVNAGLTLAQGAAAALTPAILQTTDVDNTEAELVYTLTDAPSAGSMVRDVDGSGTVTAGDQVLALDDTFTQEDLTAGRILYEHSGSGDLNDGFGFSVSDGIERLTGQTFAITAVPPNSAPAPEADSYGTAFGTALSIAGPGVLGNDTDADGDALEVIGFTPLDPLVGSLTITPDGALDFVPASGFSGIATTSYTVSDGLETSVATVSIEVGPRPPTQYSVSTESADEGRTMMFTVTRLNNTDTISPRLGIAWADGTAVEGTDYQETFYPPFELGLGEDTRSFFVNTLQDSEVEGDETFFLQLIDLSSGTVLASGQGTILDDDSVNLDPEAGENTVPWREDDVFSGDFDDYASDPDGDPLSYRVIDGPENGFIVVNPDGSFQYQPDSDWFGTEIIVYTAEDGRGGINTGRLTLELAPVNDAPVAGSDSFDSPAGRSFTYDVLDIASDVDGDPLQLASLSADNGASLTQIGDTQFRVTPAFGFTGLVTVSFTVTDGTAASNVGTLELTVTEPNVAPDARDDFYETTFQTAISGISLNGLLWNDGDADGDALEVIGTLNAIGGTVDSISASGGFLFTPDAGFTGTASFEYILSDGTETSIATATIEVAAVGVPYVMNDLVAEEGQVMYFTAIRADAGAASNLLSARYVDGTATGGAAAGAGIDYNAAGFAPFNFGVGQTELLLPVPIYADFEIEGDETFTIELFDTVTGEVLATAQGTIVGAYDNTAPVAYDFTVNINEDEMTTIEPLAHAFDAEGDWLYINGYSGVVPGSLAPLPSSWLYTPDPDWNGSFTITYTLDDGVSLSNEATVTVNVLPVNDDPEAVNDTASTVADTAVSIDVLANDGDVDGDSLTVTAVAAAVGGTVAIDGGTGEVVFTPNAGFTGTGSFEYTVEDGNGGSDIGVVSVTVAPGAGAIVGTPGDDRLEGTPDPDQISGLAGDDLLLGRAAGDDMDGGAGNDTLRGEAGDDTLDGGEDDDKVQGDEGDDSVSGGSGADRVYGGTGDDTVLGGDGDDVLYGDAPNGAGGGFIGADIFAFDADDGTDRVFDFVSGVDRIRLDGPAGLTPVFSFDATRGDTVMTYGSTTVTFFNQMVSAADNLLSSLNGKPMAEPDAVETDAGVAVAIDVLANDSDPDGDELSLDGVVSVASNGIVTLDDGGTVGDASDDSFVYTPNAGFIGQDSFVYRVDDGQGGFAAGLVTIDVGVETLTGSAGADRISGGDGRQVIEGLDGADKLLGGTGSDTLEGGAGSDKLLGEDGNDLLLGGDDVDRLYGGFGDDTLEGGAGDDVLYGDLADRDNGDLGADTFVFGLADGTDKVFDFVSGIDTVELVGSNAFTLSQEDGDTTILFGTTEITFYDSLLVAADVNAHL
ncbi:tandem-95 repeat protein [Salipiger bermudensis]|uniref:Ig-like domain-containing protein n=1 Tax=Salipiger bermudensis TaxID=344736 RepID=UPI001C993CCA|nr:Ig-like domain-containing protein [Salipiger bermudensis]MBY6003563.1 tandem-95 repeat protein [Salipiger bermudensis]